MKNIDEADPSKDKYEVLDRYLQRVRDLEHKLNCQAKRMSTSEISKVLEEGNIRELRQVLGAVEASIAAAESGLAQIVTEMHRV